MRKTRRHVTVGVMVTLGLAGAGPTADADQTEPLTIVLRVRDTAPVPEDVLTDAQTAVTAIFRQAGVQTVWRALSSWSVHTEAPREPRLTIAILSPGQTERLSSVLVRDALGLVVNGPTAHATVAYVFYHRVKHRTGSNGITPAPLLGAAMAHEIGHLLLPPKAHSPVGLMRADWTKADLQRIQRTELFFTPGQSELIRLQIAGAAAVSGEGIGGSHESRASTAWQWFDGIDVRPRLAHEKRDTDAYLWLSRTRSEADDCRVAGEARATFTVVETVDSTRYGPASVSTHRAPMVVEPSDGLERGREGRESATMRHRVRSDGAGR